jgi:hypothetical protein
MTIEADEVGSMQTGGLIVGSKTVVASAPRVASIGIVDLSLEHTSQLVGIVTLAAIDAGAPITFSSSASTFYGLHSQADNGVIVDVDLTTTSASLQLDGNTQIQFNGDRTLTSKRELELMSDTVADGALTLNAGTGVLLQGSLTVNGANNVVIVADTENLGYGTMTVVSGNTVSVAAGLIDVSVWDLDLQGSMTATAISVSATKTCDSSDLACKDQTIAIGETSADMHVSDDELLRMNVPDPGTIIFTRLTTSLQGGSILVDRVSRIYRTQAPSSIVFGGPTGSQTVSSRDRISGMQQFETKAYATTADFSAAEPNGIPTVTVPDVLTLGSSISVQWNADTTGGRVSHEHDWIGLYRRGTCNDETTTTRHNIVHECYLAWTYVGAGLQSGEIEFPYSSYSQSGEYEVRYFFGDSTDGQGYRCETLRDTTSIFRQCVLRARATSKTIVIGGGNADSSASLQVPGLVEKYCDGGSSVCE